MRQRDSYPPGGTQSKRRKKRGGGGLLRSTAFRAPKPGYYFVFVGERKAIGMVSWLPARRLCHTRRLPSRVRHDQRQMRLAPSAVGDGHFAARTGSKSSQPQSRHKPPFLILMRYIYGCRWWTQEEQLCNRAFGIGRKSVPASNRRHAAWFCFAAALMLKHTPAEPRRIVNCPGSVCRAQ